MITISIISGFVLLTLLLITLRWPTVAFALAAPAAYLCYFLFINEIKDTLGYPVDVNLVEQTKATYLYSFETQDGVFVMVREDGKADPRLIRYEKTQDMREKVNELNKRKGAKRITVGKKKFALAPGEGDDTKGKRSGGKTTKKGKSTAGSDGETNKLDGMILEPPESLLPAKQ